jgi:hypothetical protein
MIAWALTDNDCGGYDDRRTPHEANPHFQNVRRLTNGNRHREDKAGAEV